MNVDESFHSALFADPRSQMIDDGYARDRRVMRRDPFGMMMPFGGGGLFGSFFGGGGIMQQMVRRRAHAIPLSSCAHLQDAMRDRAMNDPNSHVYSQSTVFSLDHSGDYPVVREETHSVRKAGNVKEVESI